MSQVFKNYSKYYDLLYSDKDYKGEVEYIKKIILSNYPSAKTILDLGCGTGVHANLLASEGFIVTGVDLSSEMIGVANSKKESDYLENKEKLTFISGDIRNIRLKDKFDVVVSLFHVFSYLNTNRDINAGLETMYFHTKESGLIFFDFWYGPAVLSQMPSCKVKRMSNRELEVTRFATPEIDEIRNTVIIDFEIFVREGTMENYCRIDEKHEMRYFFIPELDLLTEKFNFQKKQELAWMRYSAPEMSTWGACMILVK